MYIQQVKCENVTEVVKEVGRDLLEACFNDGVPVFDSGDRVRMADC